MKFSTFTKLVMISICTSLAFSCKQIQAVSDILLSPSAREIYAREFSEQDSLFVAWKDAFRQARMDSLQIELPFAIQGHFALEEPVAYAYRGFLHEGRQLKIDIRYEDAPAKIFIDLYRLKAEDDERKDPVHSSMIHAGQSLSFPVKQSGNYQIVIQPSLATATDFTLSMYTQPSYIFPVAGHGNKSIQSFWGDPRGGGSRIHQGVDIFAKRGTPVVAVAKGRIHFAGEKGLGGKQVWLRESLVGRSFYYAHLDSFVVSTGEQVAVGDTLGFVGNTGNASKTVPHLHFGLYKGYSGPVDPLPYIRQAEIPQTDAIQIAPRGLLVAGKANIRQGPDTQFPILTTLTEKAELNILGKTGTWYHVKLPDSLQGFVHTSLVREAGA